MRGRSHNTRDKDEPGKQTLKRDDMMWRLRKVMKIKSSLPVSNLSLSRATSKSNLIVLLRPRKIMGLTRLPPTPNNPQPRYRQVDIRRCPMDSLPLMLLRNTGDRQSMKILRKQAAIKGWVLNAYEMGKRDIGKAGLHPCSIHLPPYLH